MEDHPLVPARGVVLADQFRAASGVGPEDLRRLVLAGLLDGLVDETGRVLGLFEDTLPTSARLREVGVVPREDYRPEALVTEEVEDDDVADDEDESPSWSISWEDPETGERPDAPRS